MRRGSLQKRLKNVPWYAIDYYVIIHAAAAAAAAA